VPDPLIIRNCRLYDAPPGAPAVDIRLAGGVIAAIEPATIRPAWEPGLDVGGRLVVPGPIDVHAHGAGGADVFDGTPEALETVARTLARLGTTAFLATTMMDPQRAHQHLQAAVTTVGRDLGGARNLGIHLEGPFINPQRKGALPLASIYAATRAAVDEVLDRTAGTLRMITIAPELEGGLAAIERFVEDGVVASFGHSAASYDQTRAGLAAGLSHVTHLFNAMPSLHHRDPGPLPALIEAGEVTAQLICDGAHVHPAVVRFGARLLGPGRCVCITDSMRALGLPDGRYVFAGREFESRHGTARYDDGTLIGTTLGLVQMALNFQRFTGCSTVAAFDSISRLPAAVLGISDRKGALATGKDADLVVVDPEDARVWATVVGGTIVYRA
jgi:N-acetylglucosamine-6-phosphate deacetylase